MNATISLKEYLDKGKCFVVPFYQRGYVWGRKRRDGGKDAVSYMLEALLNGYKSGTDVFIQGVTVSEKADEIILIDGQQRTTFFYLLLKYLHYKGSFHMRYEIRKESNDFLDSLEREMVLDVNPKEKYQDLFFFRITLKLINGSPIGKLDDEERERFIEYVLNHIKFLYIDIPLEKATTVFAMMNGNKAEMKAEELIKAELLRLVSLNEKSKSEMSDNEYYAVEWDNNMLRSRYAREWDKWLQWWNRDDVKKLYKVDNVMGLLVPTFQKTGKQVPLSFDNFKSKFLVDQRPVDAKITFDKLRRLQKRFEDAFNTPIVYNKIGAIIRVSNSDRFIQWYFTGEIEETVNSIESIGEKKSDEELDAYYRMVFLGMSHKKITDILDKRKDKKNDQTDSDGDESIQTYYERCYNALTSNDLYNENSDEAFRLLLRLNIDEDNKQNSGEGRKFDFSIWNNRSLEHIYPKSKVWHVEKDAEDNELYKDGNGKPLEEDDIKKEGYIRREDCICKGNDGKETKASEHSIGNLVLLYKDENSSFSNSSFEEKKSLYFKKPDKEIKPIFKSRHLLHTIYKFANSSWTAEDIAKNKMQTLLEFEKYYEDLRNRKYGKE